MTKKANKSSHHIMKNTLTLYVRMFFVIIINLFTSRVILEVLGVDDYGIYNVVGGIVVLFTFLNTTMSSSTSRFITFELGRNDLIEVNKVFNTALIIHIAIALIILLIAETVGLWFLENQLNISENRMFAARIVYQLSILVCMVSVIQVPYQASIIANEKMDIYAIISVVDVVLKLLILYIVDIFTYDSLILYALFLFIVVCLIFTFYVFYCSSYLPGCDFHFSYNTSKAKSMLSFSGWDLYGNSSALAASQGINFLLNIFFGVAVNAAIGIANQFNSGINVFSNNFLLAVRPQIVKRYANGEYTSLMGLIYNSAKYSYFLLLLIAVPFFFEVDFILGIWLGKVPEHLNIFCRIFIIKSLFAVCCSSVLTMLVHAIGRMKKFSFYRGTIILLTLPISYVALKFYNIPYIPIVINAIMDILASFYTILLVRQLFNEFSIVLYIKKVILPCIIMTLISLASSYIINLIFFQSLLRLVLVFMFNLSAIVFVLYFFIIDINTKALVNAKIGDLLRSYKS